MGMNRKKIQWAALMLAGAANIALVDMAFGQSVQRVTKTEIIIGSHSDLSGVAASYGVGSTNAIRMRFDEANESGGIHGRKIRFIVEDHGYQVPKAVQAANKLIKRDKIFLMTGSLGTPMNLAVFNEQFEANIPNLFPLTAARQMAEPFHKLKFAAYPSYYDQLRAGVKWMVETKGKKRLCIMYQDTDFGKEILEAVQDQAKAMNMTIVETTTHKPTDQDFTAQITKLKAANCDLVGMGVIIRDAIIPYATARKVGWTDVDFIGSSASFDAIVAAAQGNATEGYYTMGYFQMPYYDTARPEVKAWWDKYKAKFGQDPSIGAAYGYGGADMVVQGLKNAGPNLTTESFVKGMEQIQGYTDIFGSVPGSFGPSKHVGTDTTLVMQVRNGRFTVVSHPVKH